jgi:uncharacterized membrane protein
MDIDEHDAASADHHHHQRERQRARARRRRGGGDLPGARLHRASIVALWALAGITVVGMVLLWPHNAEDKLASVRKAVHTKTYAATLERISEERCEFGGTCTEVAARMQEGPDAGTTISFQTNPDSLGLPLSVGDKVRLVALSDAGGPQGSYTFADFQRTKQLAWLFGVFVVMITLLSRLQGLRALVGLGVSLSIVVYFIVPAMISGEPPLLVAVVGALAVMISTIVMSHGTGPKTTAAILGAAMSLMLTIGLAWLFANIAHLSGFTSEEASLLRTGGLPLQGLLLAGVIIGTMGVLDDVTVSQASTVMALRRANAKLRFRELFRSALAVGNDHIAATINTLVLAYTGASLSVLIILAAGNTNLLEAINNEVVAQEVVAMLVGSIGLIAAVPITTALAAGLALRVRPEELPEHDHVHIH